MDGDAIQNDITGASGPPPVHSDRLIGVALHEQSGLIEPMNVANKIEIAGLRTIAFRTYFAAPETFTATATGIVSSSSHQLRASAFSTNLKTPRTPSIPILL